MSKEHWVVLVVGILVLLYIRFVQVATSKERQMREMRTDLNESLLNRSRKP